MPKIQTILPNLCISVVLLLSATPGKAQITPDNTLGAERSVVTPNTLVKGANADLINGGAQRGRNLFHSFSDFNVNAGQSVYFANPSDVTNILTRVTGGNKSNILGTLGVDGTANLFLINPAGILFGKNATLDLKGSFVGTTANGVQFGNLGSFSATNPQAPPPLLTIDPSGLLFNQLNQQATITNQSLGGAGVDLTGASVTGLRVPDGKSLLLVGGDVVLDGGKLNALGGRVELGGLAAPGTVGLQSNNGNDLSLSFQASVQRADVSVGNGSSVRVNSNGGGNIVVNANNVNISGASTLIGGIEQGSGTIGAKAGDITLNATGDIKIDGNGSGIGNNVKQQAIGNGGNITLSSNTFGLTGGAELQAITLGQGNSGNVIVNATKSVSLDGSGSDIFSTVGFVDNSQNNLVKGNSGDIQITTDQLSLSNGAQLLASTYGQGSAGNVIVNATKSVSLNGSAIFSTVGASNDNQNNLAIGKGGNIQITTDQLSLTNGAQLGASTLGQGNAGNVIINASKSVSFDGAAGILSTVGDAGSTAQQNSIAKGKGGNIQITTDQLSLINGAQLEANTYGQGNAGNVIVNATNAVNIGGANKTFPSSIRSIVGDGAIGNGGDIQITAGSVSLTDGGQLVASTSGQGNPGNVSINARDAVTLAGVNNGISSGIFTYVDSTAIVQSTGVSNGGNINIQAGSLSLQNGALLEASTFGQGNAGNVIVNATKSVSLDGSDTTILSTVGDVDNSPQQNSVAKGNGGNIQITTDQLSLTNGAQLETVTFGQGNAGNVIVNASKSVSLDGHYTTFPSAIFTSSVTNGKGGDIQINTGELSVTNSAELDASNFGQGNAGTLEIRAGSIRLDNGSINATTNSGNGGDIKLTAQDYILLRNGSLISTSAATAGDGGKIIINTPFIVAIPNENNNITANADIGSPGQINISAQLFGIEPRVQLLPPENDITAFSQQGVQGQIVTTQPQVDLVSGLVAPPIQLSDVTSKFSQLCPNTANPKKKPLGSFVITGKGSIPPNPLELLPGRNPDIPLANAEDMQEIRTIQAQEQKKKEEQEHNTKVGRKKNKDNTLPSIVEAQGIVQTPDGQIYFVANANHATPSSQPTASPCPSQN